MNPEVFQMLMNSILFLGQKKEKTRDEVVAYLGFLRYATALANLNTELVESEIRRRDAEFFGDGNTGESTQRVA